MPRKWPPSAFPLPAAKIRFRHLIFFFPCPRRRWLQATAPFRVRRVRSLSGAPRDCCSLPDLTSDAARIEPGLVVIGLARAPTQRQMVRPGDPKIAVFFEFREGGHSGSVLYKL